MKKLERVQKLIPIPFIFVLLSCGESIQPTLDTFEAEKDVFESGKSLISLPFDLHDLEEVAVDQNTLLIGVHGSNSRGYEWIYPLQRLNNDGNMVSFFRWDDDACPNPSMSSLLSLIKEKFNNNPNLNKVILLGHSYGGLLVVAFAKAWDMDVPLQIHSIAAPLKGMGIINSICDFELPNIVENNIELHQWRTIKELDGAFSDLDYDPQVVKILKSKVTRLPETYKGNKLGHNWSISWVADEISKED
jgi:hypothetical protein